MCLDSARPALSAARPGRSRRGFNLIEAAIVLGVVGLMVGGIWIAASAVMEKLRVEKTATGLMVISDNIQRLISQSQANSIPNGSSLTSLVIAAKAVPEDWINGTTILSPIGSLGIGNEVNQFYIQVGGADRSRCVALMVKLSSIAAMRGNRNSGTYVGGQFRPDLARIMIYTNGGAFLPYDNFPIDIITADSACASVNLMLFYWTYSRPN